MASKSLFSSTIGRKFAMALSALFLLFFLFQHFLINFLSVISPDLFNAASHFMGTNPFVQFLLQPVLILAIFFHFIMGIILELQNRKARGKERYAYNKPSKNSTWMSRNMIWTGLLVELFLVVHMAGFWWHEMQVKYISPDKFSEAKESSTRYYGELVEYFQNPWMVLFYAVAIIILSLHLMHGFQSAFQSTGANHSKYTPVIKAAGKWYSILIPAGFIFIAVYHYLVH